MRIEIRHRLLLLVFNRQNQLLQQRHRFQLHPVENTIRPFHVSEQMLNVCRCSSFSFIYMWRAMSSSSKAVKKVQQTIHSSLSSLIDLPETVDHRDRTEKNISFQNFHLHSPRLKLRLKNGRSQSINSPVDFSSVFQLHDSIDLRFHRAMSKQISTSRGSHSPKIFIVS